MKTIVYNCIYSNISPLHNRLPLTCFSALDLAPSKLQLQGSAVIGVSDHIQVMERISADYSALGTCLLNDIDGAKLGAIVNNHHLTEKIVDAVLTDWLRGKGQSTTWRTLIKCLYDAQLKNLAQDLKTALCFVERDDTLKVSLLDLYVP